MVLNNTFNLKQPVGRFWVRSTAFLPLLLLFANASVSSGSLASIAASLLAFIAIPCFQIAGAVQMITYSREEISWYQCGVWFINAVVSWTIFFTDPVCWQKAIDLLD